MNGAPNIRCVIAFLLFSLLAASGCAHHTAVTVPAEADRVSLGTVGVASGKYSPEASFLVPAKGAGQGALLGAGIGFIAPVAGFASASGPYGLVIGAAVGAVFAPVGAIIGALTAMPLEEAQSSESALRKALADLKIQESLRGRLIAEAKQGAGSRSFRPVDRGPTSPSEKPAYGTLASDGIDSVLEVKATGLGLKGLEWGSDPPMEFFLEVKLRLVRVRDDADLYGRPFVYRSPAHRFSAWAKDDGKLLEEESGRACGEIAERMVEEVFFLVPLP